ncbi:hypothetical protein J5Y09_18500 [Roseomonas sp. PWR1]|uniref:Lipoprotein n=1 Tax=Roseomonas nitratireducens TaxID=2820810 RepID=A0ABS4AX30_9PROT|nr:hypothetical protein [Neoroseomonas nitratireducens]MBP0465923.1 hypothetical protein [Neoroseomonas nitratireducens]
MPPGLRPACLLPLLLMGCAAEREAEQARAMEQALRSARAGLVAPAAPAVRPPTPTQARPPAGAVSSAAALAGLRAEDLRRRLGEPALRRPEGDAEIWLYEAPGCRLDVILYPEGGALLVGHAAARAHGGARVTEAACLAALPGRAP